MSPAASKSLAVALASAIALSACATGGSYVQRDQYGDQTQQQNRTGRNALIGTAIVWPPACSPATAPPNAVSTR